MSRCIRIYQACATGCREFHEIWLSVFPESPVLPTSWPKDTQGCGDENGPGVSILGADQKNRVLWGRECVLLHCIDHIVKEIFSLIITNTTIHATKMQTKAPVVFSQSDLSDLNNESVNRGLPVLGAARGLNSWCWPKGSWPLGTRMNKYTTIFMSKHVPI